MDLKGLSGLSDEALIHHAKTNGSYNQVMDEIYTRYSRLIVNVGKRMGFDQEACKDLVQETMMKFLKSYANFDPSRAKLGTYLYRVATNEAIDVIRKNREDATEDEFLYLSQTDFTDRIADNPGKNVGKYSLSRLEKALESLSETHRHFIEDYYYRGIRSPEIAEQYGVNPSTLRGRLRSALFRLKKEMSE